MVGLAEVLFHRGLTVCEDKFRRRVVDPNMLLGHVKLELLTKDGDVLQVAHHVVQSLVTAHLDHGCVGLVLHKENLVDVAILAEQVEDASTVPVGRLQAVHQQHAGLAVVLKAPMPMPPPVR